MSLRSDMDLLSDFEAPDPVTEVLRAVRIRSTVYCRSVMGAPWGFGVTAHGNPAFHLVTTGTCWLEVDGEPDQIPLTAGDLVVLPTGQRHWLRDNPATPATELEELLAATPLDEHGPNPQPGRLLWNLETPDVHGDFERFKAAGATVVQEPYQPDEDPEAWIATFADPDDNYFQLVSPFPG